MCSRLDKTEKGSDIIRQVLRTTQWQALIIADALNNILSIIITIIFVKLIIIIIMNIAFSITDSQCTHSTGCRHKRCQIVIEKFVFGMLEWIKVDHLIRHNCKWDGELCILLHSCSKCFLELQNGRITLEWIAVLLCGIIGRAALGAQESYWQHNISDTQFLYHFKCSIEVQHTDGEKAKWG